MTKNKIKIFFNKFNIDYIENFIERIGKEQISFKFYPKNYRGKVDVNLVFTNDPAELTKIVEEYNLSKIIIVTERINPEVIIEFLKYTNCICYLNASSNLIINKIKFYIFSR